MAAGAASDAIILFIDTKIANPFIYRYKNRHPPFWACFRVNIALAVLAASMIFASCATKETAAPISYAETVVNTTSNAAVSVTG